MRQFISVDLEDFFKVLSEKCPEVRTIGLQLIRDEHSNKYDVGCLYLDTVEVESNIIGCRIWVHFSRATNSPMTLTIRDNDVEEALPSSLLHLLADVIACNNVFVLKHGAYTEEYNRYGKYAKYMKGIGELTHEIWGSSKWGE